MSAAELADIIEHLAKALAAEGVPSHVAREINDTILRLLRRIESMVGVGE